jgi:hypothetical protein
MYVSRAVSLATTERRDDILNDLWAGFTEQPTLVQQLYLHQM